MAAAVAERPDQLNTNSFDSMDKLEMSPATVTHTNTYSSPSATIQNDAEHSNPLSPLTPPASEDTKTKQTAAPEEAHLQEAAVEEDEDAGLTAKQKRPHCKKFFQWVPTDEDQLARSERRMFKSVRHMITQKTVAGLKTIQSLDPSHPDDHIVLVHGFAGGSANWLPNWKALAEHMNVYAIDLPGFGRSYRPTDVKFKSAESAIEFMTDSILMWVKEMKLCDGGKKITFCGHSFGAYVCSNFAIRYPTMVKRLVLTDPWGCQKEYDRKMPFRFRVATKLFYCVNPLGALRAPWGPSVLPKVRKDFADRWEAHIEDPQDFYDYTFHCNAASPPVGEQAFQACCTGPAFAKLPLETIIPEELDPSVELGIIFGQRTWMDTQAGKRILDGYMAKGGKVSSPVVRYIPDAGHQVMSDNARDYNNVLLELLDVATLM